VIPLVKLLDVACIRAGVAYNSAVLDYFSGP